jgi:cold shock CspA family protein
MNDLLARTLRGREFTGKIRQLVRGNHYGFITVDAPELKDVFFHADHLLDVAFKELRIGDKVSFYIDTDEKNRIGARSLRVLTGDTLIPFKDIQFGYASAEDESTKCPILLVEGFIDNEGFAHELCFGSRFLVLGDKGSGKSALGEHLRLSSQDRHDMFIKTIYLSDFPFVNFTKIINTDDLPASRYPAAWSWLLLLYLIESISNDEGASTALDHEFQRILTCLNRLGLIPSPSVKQLVNSSTSTSFKLNLSPFFEVTRNTASPKTEEVIPFFVENLKNLLATCRSASKHLLIIDGLDDILTFEPVQYEALGALLLEASRLNSHFFQADCPCKVVLLCRTNLFERLPGPNKNKVRQDSAIYLDWYGGERDPRNTKLVQLANNRAKLSDDRIHEVFDAYFPRLYYGKDIIKFFLAYTRHNPRDFLQLLKAIQRHEKSVRVWKDAIRAGLADYCENYFLPEIKDTLDGYLDNTTIDLVFHLLATLGKRRFSLAALTNTVESTPRYQAIELNKILDALFECSAIGNVRELANKSEYASFKFRNRNSVFNQANDIVLQNAIWLALSAQHGASIDEDFFNFEMEEDLS